MNLKPERPLHVLMVTSEWPTPEHPEWVPFLVDQVRSLREAGVEVDVFPFRGGKNPLRYLAAWLRLRRTHRLKTYDVIHAQFAQSVLVVWPAPVPVVVTFHGSDVLGYVGADGRYSFASQVLRRVARWAARRAQGRIVVADHLRRALPGGLVYHTILCGIDLVRFQPLLQPEARTRLGLPLEKRLVAFVGNPANPIKRYALAQQVVQQLPAELGAELITVSGVSHDQMPVYFSACDALLLTSAHEGSPTVVKEALACGLPVVATDVGDVRERLAGVEGCDVCSEDAPESLATALGKVLRSGRRVDGKQTVALLSLEYIAQRIILVYRSVIKHG